MHIVSSREWRSAGKKDPWSEVVKGRGRVRQAIFVDMGIGDVCVGFFEFEDDTYLVGEGESLRSFRQHYTGNEHGEATVAFVRACADLLEDD